MSLGRDKNVKWKVLQCVAVCCSVLQCVAVCCSVLRCVAGCCIIKIIRCVETGLSFAKEVWNAWRNAFISMCLSLSLSCNLCLSQRVFQICVCLFTHVSLCVSGLHACLISFRVWSPCISHSLRWDTRLNLQISKQSCNIISLSLFMISVCIHGWIMYRTKFPSI